MPGLWQAVTDAYGLRSRGFERGKEKSRKALDLTGFGAAARRHREPVALPVVDVLALLPSWREPVPDAFQRHRELLPLCW